MIDGGIFLGRNPSTGISLEAVDLIHRLNQLDVSRAIVSAYQSIFYDSLEGNLETLDFASKHPHRMIPSVTIQSLGCDFTDPASSMKRWKRLGAKVLGMYKRPSYYPIDFKNPVNQALAHSAAQNKMVVQFGVESVNDLTDIYHFYGSLRAPVLVRWMAGQGYQAVASMLYIAKRHSNFYFDVGSITSIGAIEHLVSKIGAKRLYCASNLPEGFASSSQFLLRSAKLNRKDLNFISRGTLNQFFGQSSQFVTPSKTNHTMDEQYKSYRTIPKIDTHWHSEGWNLIEPKKGLEFFDFSKGFYNIQKAVFSSIKALNGFMEEGNRGVFEWVVKIPGVYALVVVDPTKPKESMREIKKYSRHPRCVGIKTIQDLYELGLDSREYSSIISSASKERLTVMAHIRGMANVARRYPRMRFVCAHATWDRVKEFIHQKNVYFDLATSHRYTAETKLPDMIRMAGSRLLFASDAPLMDPAWTLGKIADTKISKRTLKRIFYENALAAFPKLKK